jgi:hypothetical protein
MALSNWPAYTDDTGAKTDGTIINAALLDAMKDAIEDEIVSATNPSVSPNTIIDEIVAARGSKADLDERLDVAINDDGTLKDVAGQASESQVSAQIGARNLIRNHDLARWSRGNALAPDHFVLSGAGAAVARAGAGESDTTHMEAGLYTVKVTSGGGAAAKLTATPVSAADVTLADEWQGRTIQLSALVQAGAGSTARLIVDDGVGTTASDYHTGGGTPEFLTVEHDVSSSATKIDVYLEVAAGNNVVYMNGPQLIVSDIALTEWAPELSIWQSKHNIVIASFTNGTDEDFYSVTASGEEIAWTLPGGIPAEAIKEGQGLHVRFTVELANNTNSKTITLYLGAVQLLLIAATTTAADRYFIADVNLIRVADAVVAQTGFAGYLTVAGAAGSSLVYPYGDGVYGATDVVDFTTAQAFTIRLNGGAAADLILKSGGIVEYLP